MLGNQFCTADATLVVDDIRTGTLYIRQGPATDSMIVNGTGISPLALALTENPSIATNPAGQGSFTDPEDPKLVITYQYDSTRISTGSIFTTCLDGLAEVPQHDQEGFDVLINARSASGDCTITLEGKDLKWRLAGKVMLYMYSNIMLKQRRFGGMTLVLAYDGVDVGEGVVAKVGGAVA